MRARSSIALRFWFLASALLNFMLIRHGQGSDDQNWPKRLMARLFKFLKMEPIQTQFLGNFGKNCDFSRGASFPCLILNFQNFRGIHFPGGNGSFSGKIEN